MLSGNIRVGCAGWAIPKQHAARFPIAGSHLSRYSKIFPAVEINSTFYKLHKPATFKRWADSVPEDFRFSVKLPRSATHECRLVNIEEILDRFLPEATSLGKKLGPLLVQLPPSLTFSATIAEKFLLALRQRFDGDVVLEPRHASWSETDAENLLVSYRVARAAADPSVMAKAAHPGGWDGLVYYRLHGSPSIYYSDYPIEYLETVANSLAAAAVQSVDSWCILDNTAAGAATANAMAVLDRMPHNLG